MVKGLPDATRVVFDDKRVIACPQSTSAILAGAWICGTNNSPTANPSARRRLRT